MITLNNDPQKENVFELIERANKQGVVLDFTAEKLVVKVPEETQVSNELMDELRSSKEDLILFLRNKKATRTAVNSHQTSIRSFLDQQIFDSEHIPLSFSQQRLWVLDKLSGSTHYHIPIVLKWQKSLEPSCFKQAFQQMIERHQVLRTVFLENDGNVYQVVLEAFETNLQFETVESIGGIANLDAYLKQETQKPFDLSLDVKVRAKVIRFSEHEYTVLFVFHHIATDGWSGSIFLGELLHYYKAFLQGEPDQLPALPLQFADYARWEQLMLNGPAMDASIAFWKDYLKDVQPIELPLDFPRKVNRNKAGGAVSYSLDTSTSQTIRTICNENEATLFMLMQAAITVLLFRYTGQVDICIGAPVANRGFKEVEPLIGFFLNNLVLRNDLSGNPRFDELLKRIKSTTLEVYEHQELPFEKIVEALGLERNTSINPLFQVTITMHSQANNIAMEQDETSVTVVSLEQETALFDLGFHITETADGIQLGINYAADLFDKRTIAQMVAQLGILLQSIAENPQCPIETLPILSKETIDAIKQKQYLSLHAEFPQQKNIVQLFEEQVEVTPTNIAVSFGDHTLTYEALNKRANQLARYLTQQGLSKEGLVLLCLERSLDMIVAMLAVAKAGGAYVPAGHDFPAKRLDFLIEDAAPTFIICQNTTVAAFETLQHTTILNLNQLEDTITAYPTGNLGIHIAPDQLFYIIYTSGTTGQPKGAMITHQNVVRLFKTTPALFDFNSKDVLTLFHNYYFDFSVWEIYGALLFGGRIEVVSETLAKDTPAFLQFLLDKQVTVLNQTPAAFYNLQELASVVEPNLAVRYVIFGGEALHPSKLAFWNTHYPACKLINMYGITETTVHVTFKKISENDINNGCSNIGKPIPTLGVFVLDKHQQLVPQGATGELFVTGYGLARGYLNRAELTADRFIKIPTLGGQYFYKTGDLVQMSPDGDLRYIGRADHQVKVRGYRIELGEIENTLLQISQVSQCCTIVHTTAAGTQQLVAYVVGDSGLDKQQLQKMLRKTLPEYMIPAVFIPLAIMPLNQNGKIDRKALPVPSEADFYTTAYEAPATPIALQLAAIWSRLLPAKRIGIHDSFFTVGGDSILVIKTISDIQKIFGVQIPVADYYNSPTIADIAAYLEVHTALDTTAKTAQKDATAYLDNLAKEVRQAYTGLYELEDAYPMTDIQKGMVFASIADKALAIYHDQMAYPMTDVQVDVFKKALQLMVQKHPSLRTAYNLSDFKEEVQLLVKTIPIDVEMYDISHLTIKAQEEHLQNYQRKQRAKSFDFTMPPLWRSAIFHCSGNNAVHVFQFHHSILDGWSFASLVEELNQTYLALLKDPGYNPGTLKCNWKDAVLASLTQKNNQQGLLYWNQKLEGYKRTSFFTTEEVQERHVVAFGKEKLGVLKTLAAQWGISLKAVFLGIYLQTMRLFTYYNEVTIGLVANTRPYQEDGEKMLGCFLNTIPFRYQFSNEKNNWKHFLEDIEMQLRQLKSFDQVTLFEIAKYTGEQVHEQNPFFDLIFNYTDFHVLNSALQENDNPAKIATVPILPETPEYTATNTFLDCTVSITGNQLQIGYWQRRAFVEGISLELMGQQIDAILHQLLANPDDVIELANFLITNDQDQIHNVFNLTHYTFDGANSLTKLLEEQAAKTPWAIATIAGENRLTYKDLHEKADQLAQTLIGRGVVPNQPVAVCLERSNEMIIAILAILKAGGAYVPLDPAYPTSHLAYIVNDTQAKVIVTEKRFAPLFEKMEHVFFLLMDEPQNTLTSRLPYPEVAPDHAAYIIYTSGSTGQPKGVVINHESIVNRLLWMQHIYQLQPESDIVLQKTTYCFDVSVWEFFWPLITGAKLLFAKPGGHKESRYLKALIEQERITTVHFVPSMLEVFLLHIEKGDCPSLQRVICSGEALLPAHVNSFNATLPRATLHNLYGPTEAAVDVSYWEAPKDKETVLVPIGKPVANTRLYIVREDGLPCGIGVPGELHIAGIQLAKGYLNRPELTREKFVYSPVAKERVYKTGDLAYWLPDGNIAYLGRIDQQVKIRGHRIELGEIEQVLLKAPSVMQSAVTAFEPAAGVKQLYAYVVTDGNADGQQIRDFVASKLPDFMVPSAVIVINEMPLTANGKLNRGALSKPTDNNYQHTTYQEPETNIEKTMAQIWATYLQLPQIGRKDHFFQAGGNSLTATRVAIAIQKEWGVELSVRDMFQYPVLEALCKYVALECLQDDPALVESTIYDL